MQLQGTYTALVTPFRNGQVDWDAMRRLIEEQVAAGISGLVPVGTTGESPTLVRAEELRLFREIKEALGDNTSVIAGTGSNSTAEALEATRQAEEVGVDGCLLGDPLLQ